MPASRHGNIKKNETERRSMEFIWMEYSGASFYRAKVSLHEQMGAHSLLPNGRRYLRNASEGHIVDGTAATFANVLPCYPPRLFERTNPPATISPISFIFNN
jgi:hypothetical protein